MTEYSKLMTTYDQDVNFLTHPTGVDLTTGILPLIEITQDKSTFTMCDWHQTKWDHADAKQPEEKKEGHLLLISGMLTQEWGELEHNSVWVGFFSSHDLHLDSFSTLHITFKAGKNQDGYIDNDDLIWQVELSMDIFVDKTHSFKGALFLFDNTTSHQKWVLDTPSACKMVKNLKLGWTPHPGGPKMWDSMLLDESIQLFYFTDGHPTMPGWFKGMKVVLEEHRLFQLQDNSKPLNGECKDFKCAKGAMDCCCHCILFNQPDFTYVKSHLEEVITVHGHLCNL